MRIINFKKNVETIIFKLTLNEKIVQKYWKKYNCPFVLDPKSLSWNYFLKIKLKWKLAIRKILYRHWYRHPYILLIGQVWGIKSGSVALPGKMLFVRIILNSNTDSYLKSGKVM